MNTDYLSAIYTTNDVNGVKRVELIATNCGDIFRNVAGSFSLLHLLWMAITLVLRIRVVMNDDE